MSDGVPAGVEGKMGKVKVGKLFRQRHISRITKDTPQQCLGRLSSDVLSSLRRALREKDTARATKGNDATVVDCTWRRA